MGNYKGQLLNLSKIYKNYYLQNYDLSKEKEKKIVL